MGACLGLAKFLDTINIPTLLQKGSDLDFPILDRVLTMHQHLAPRIIQMWWVLQETYPHQHTHPCWMYKHYVALTRLFLLTGMTDRCVSNPHTPPQAYADDTAQITKDMSVAAIKK